jgi:hypothetical protein
MLTNFLRRTAMAHRLAYVSSVYDDETSTSEAADEEPHTVTDDDDHYLLTGETEQNSLSPGAIVGIVVAVALLLELIAYICCHGVNLQDDTRVNVPVSPACVGAGGAEARHEQLRPTSGDRPENLRAQERLIASFLPTGKIRSASEKPGQCSICLEDFAVGDSFKTLPCLHNDFHTACIDRWLETDTSCPLCKHPLLLGSSRRSPQSG